MKIRNGSVLCVGAGGLGSPAALYLAAAGVGRLGVIDADRVDLTNLQRQVLHGTPDVGRLKVESAREMLLCLNPGVSVETYPERLTAANALEVCRKYDVVLDGTDNFPARYLANDAAVLLSKPYVYGSVFQFEGQAGVFAPHLGGACYRCLFPEPPPPGVAPSCMEAGVLGVVPGLIGMIQATEALKLLAGIGTPLLNRLVLVDALQMRFREVKIQRDRACPLCGKSPTITKPVDLSEVCGMNQMGRIMNADDVTVQDLKKALENPSLGIKALDVREPDEQKVAAIKGVPLLPLSQLEKRYTELDPNQTYYIHCKGGTRSGKAVQFLKQKGFKNVKNVAGGITAWSDQIDSTVPKY